MRKAIPWLATAAVAFFVLLSNQSDQAVEIIGSSSEEERAELSSAISPEKEEATVKEPLFILVDVAGAVVSPGVVELISGSRVYQAVDAAGGLASEGDTRDVNLAALVEDGQKIFIPTKKETEERIKVTGTAAGDSYTPRPELDTSLSSGQNGGKVNINTEDKTELQRLSGVGPATADRILDYRRENGNFSRIEDLKNVKGIGDKTFEKLKDSIYVP